MELIDLKRMWDENKYPERMWPAFKEAFEIFLSNGVGYRRITVCDVHEFIRNLESNKGKWINGSDKEVGVGVCWSTTQDAAHAHWGYDADHKWLILLVAKIPARAINWKEAMSLFVECGAKWGTEELEIRLYTGATIEIVSVEAIVLRTRDEIAEEMWGDRKKSEPLSFEGSWSVEA